MRAACHQPDSIMCVCVFWVDIILTSIIANFVPVFVEQMDNDIVIIRYIQNEIINNKHCETTILLKQLEPPHGHIVLIPPSHPRYLIVGGSNL